MVGCLCRRATISRAQPGPVIVERLGRVQSSGEVLNRLYPRLVDGDASEGEACRAKAVHVTMIRASLEAPSLRSQVDPAPVERYTIETDSICSELP